MWILAIALPAQFKQALQIVDHAIEVRAQANAFVCFGARSVQRGVPTVQAAKPPTASSASRR